MKLYLFQSQNLSIFTQENIIINNIDKKISSILIPDTA